MFMQTTNESKTHLDKTLENVQNSTTRNDNPAAIMIPIEGLESLEKMKLQQLKKHAEIAEDEHKTGKIVAGESFFEQLLAD
jgi:hypothetical protein